jgi:hypothetical protein
MRRLLLRLDRRDRARLLLGALGVVLALVWLFSWIGSEDSFIGKYSKARSTWVSAEQIRHINDVEARIRALEANVSALVPPPEGKRTRRPSEPPSAREELRDRLHRTRELLRSLKTADSETWGAQRDALETDIADISRLLQNARSSKDMR